MNNADIAERLEDAIELMELMDVNSFKINAYRRLAQSIESEVAQLQQMEAEEIGKRFSKNMAVVLSDILRTGTFPELSQMEREVPAGVRNLLRINGLGPKKVRHLWQEAGLDSLAGLKASCISGTIALQKGFGEKIQQGILEGIGFLESVQGRLLQHKADEWASALESEWLKNGLRGMERTGNLLTWPETLPSMDFVFPESERKQIGHWLDEQSERFRLIPEQSGPRHYFIDFPDSGSSIRIFFTGKEDYDKTRMMLESEAGHWQVAAQKNIPLYNEWKKGLPEKSVYQKLGKRMVAPELRQGWLEWEDKFQTGPEPVNFQDIRGCLHNHSTWSDGRNSIREMAEWCKKKGWKYFGIADHSRSARYANGLNEDAIHSQWEEIRQLNLESGGDFCILKGIESDILGDGSLDYPEEILKGFDYVVASVHSIMKMDIRTASSRLIRAIENPYTSILGHCSGRILLRRPGYPLDYEKVIDACIANHVVIELNAHPSRLDMDFLHLRAALEKGALIAINPDAHEADGMEYMKYGIQMARKAGAIAEQVINCQSLDTVMKIFKKQQTNSVTF